MTSDDSELSQRQLIVVVQGDEAIRNSLEFALRAEGYDVACFSSGGEALANGTGLRAKALIVDHNLPDMTGTELLTRLRDRGAEGPAIFLAGRATPTFRRKAASFGASILDKPLIGDALRSRLASLLAPPPAR